MKKRTGINFFFLFLITTQCGSLYCQTFSNTATAPCDSWNSGNLYSGFQRTIAVSGLPAILDSSTEVLRQVNLQLGNTGCTGNISTYNTRIISPGGTIIQLFAPFANTSTAQWMDIKFRDDISLERVADYSITTQQNYWPWSIGYYRTDAAGAFSSVLGENPNGNWILEIAENTASEISFEKIELVFGSPVSVNDITGSTANNDCSGIVCIDDAQVIRGTNDGYAPADSNYPGNTVSGCNWNGANNNSAWFQFKPGGTTAYITVSGMVSAATTSTDMQIIVLARSGSDCSSGVWSVPSGGCPDDQPTNNAAYITPNGGNTSANIYLNGITANAEFNLSGLSSADTYYLYVDGNGGASSSFYIEISDAQPCSGCAMIASITDTVDVLCFGDSSGSATLTPSGGTTPYSYLWSNGQTDSTATALSAGNYSVTVTDNSLCTSTASVVITEPAEIFTNQNISICSGDSIFLQGSYRDTTGTYYDTLSSVNNCDSIIATNLTVNQITNATLNLDSCNSITVNAQTYTASGAYTQTLTNTAGCDSIITLNLTLNFSDTVNISQKICSGETYIFGSQTLTNPGNYSALFFNENGCDSVVNLTLTVDSAFSIQKFDTICSNDSIFLQGSYRDTTGTYYDTLQSVNGCDSLTQTNLTVLPAPNPDSAGASPALVTIFFPDSTTLFASGNGNYFWSPSEFLSCSSCANPIANPDSTTVYYLKIFAANGCIMNDSVVVIVEYPPSDVFVPNIFSPNGDSENDFLQVYGRYVDRIALTIFDRWGEKVFYCEGKKEECGWDGKYKGTVLNSAVFVYYLKVTLFDKSEIFKQGNVTLVK